ncbi:MAG: AI-2E family transporter [Clostridiales bacterium]|nr:AI-2E family transporter [Clostridiales bacterium]
MDKQKLKHNLILISFGIILYVVLLNISRVIDSINYILHIISPMIYGLVIAYVLNIPYTWLKEKVLVKLQDRWGLSTTAISVIALICTYVVLILILALLISTIIPQLIDSITQLIQNLPFYISSLETLVNDVIYKYSLENYIPGLAQIDNLWTEFKLKGSGLLTSQMPTIANYLVDLTAKFLTWALGLIISIYFLWAKEMLLRQMRNLLIAYTPRRFSNRMLEVASLANHIFNRFVAGNMIDALIIGILCFIGCSILRMPYTLLVSVIVGVTNIIPIFGPFIGAIPSAFIIIIVDPFKALLFIILIFALQQADGNIIKPHIFGTTIGLPSIWVLLSIVIGGRLLGVVGMLIGVPTFALIYYLLRDGANKKLKNMKS